MKTRFPRIVRIVTLFVFLANLLGACAGSYSTPTPVPTLLPKPTVTPPEFPKTVNLNTELEIQGTAITASQANCPELLAGMENGIILGIDPVTCTAAQDGDSTIAIKFKLSNQYLRHVFSLKIAWPTEKERGLRAAAPERTAQIEWDGQVIWSKSTLPPLKNSYYYAAQSEPILVTFVPQTVGAHEIKITVPPGMTWDINSIEITPTPYPQNLLGLAYSPYRDCQSANTKDDQPTSENVLSDLAMLRQNATAIRTYSAIGINAQIPKLANEMGVPVYAGAWLDGDIESDNEEMTGILDIARTSQIEAAIIGNEYHLRHWEEPGDLSYLLTRIQAFKNAYPEIPVGTAEIDSFVFDWSTDGTPTVKPEYQPILDQIDILFIHIYPFWSNMPVEGAAAFTIQRYQAIKSLLENEYHGTKRVIIGEAGWTSAGQQGGGYSSGGSGSGTSVAPQTGSVFHPEAQRKYMIELLALAQAQHADIFFFTSFDELWKTEGTDGTGRSWGYAYTDRTSKYNFSGLLLPPELLPPADTGDVFMPYTESDFTWAVGSYPIYTEWPLDPHGRPEGIPKDEPELYPFSLAYMGDETNIDVYQCERHTHSGETAIRVTYKPDTSIPKTLGWAGAYWLYPEKNWETVETGKNLMEAQTISLWARGAMGGEVVEFVTGGICGKYDGKAPPPCKDSIQPKLSTNQIRLTTEWQQYTLDLSNVDRSNIVGAFGLAVSSVYNSQGAVFYLDDIVFSPESPTATANVYPVPIGSTFNIYTDHTALDNHYIPSNFMGDAIKPRNFTFTPDSTTAPYSGNTSIKIDYRYGFNGWAGVYWTDPENNWGQRPGGYDLTGVSSLTFWARSEKAGQQLKILIGGISCFKDKAFPYHDSVCDVVPVPWFTLTNEWRQYTVDLTSVKKDWSQLLGGFGFVINQSGTFYLDDIIYHLNK